MNNTTLTLKNINKTFRQGNDVLEVLKDVNLEIRPREVVALIGPSGSGKSTLLQIAGLLENPTDGEVYIDGENCTGNSDNVRTALRRDYLGFVYQYHNLLQDFDAAENVIIPQLIAGVKYKEARDKAMWLLQRLGLNEREHHRPAELSGGEQQRVAIARALANTPKLLLADEPTGNLDSKNSAEIISLLRLFNKEFHQTVIMITHDEKIALSADRIIEIRDGKLVKDCRNGGESDEYSK